MNTHGVQGLALIIGGVCSLLAFLISDSTPFQYIGILGILFFIFGIPAVHVSQPTGSVGLIGIGLIILAAVIALGFGVGIFGGTNFDGALVAISAFSGLAGRLIVGWLTIKQRVFSQWIGWALIAEGVINLAGFLDLAALVSIISVVVTLVAAAAQFGYGFHIFRETKS
jgi:hypothetical protein